jgi:hypothetical protein
MTRPLLVIDDDVELLRELSAALRLDFPGLRLICPPAFDLTLKDIRRVTVGARAVVLELNISGSPTFGQSLLRNLSKVLKKSDVPAVIWSKYLPDTILYGPGGAVVMDHADGANRISEITATELASMPSARLIADLRKSYRDTRTFVTKLVPDPVHVLIGVLKRTGVVPQELASQSTL